MEADTRINADFSRRVLVHTTEIPWIPSPQPGVERCLLDRLGGEVARATSLVRYAAGAGFPAHTHQGGEEYLVLQGVFQDEKGEHPVGRYVRNPPGSQHMPSAEVETVIFVKLSQFDLADQHALEVDLSTVPFSLDVERPGVRVQYLHQDHRESVQVEHWSAGQYWYESFPQGAELLLLEGELEDGTDRLGRLSWLRLPATIL